MGLKNSKKAASNRFLLLVAGAFVVLIALFAVLLAYADLGGGCVGVVALEGAISFDDGGFLYAGTRADEFDDLMARAASDASVKSIVLFVNSPGGSAAASKEVFESVKRANARKPVVAYFADVAASGGYYAAAPSDWIVANPNTLTGSIGAVASVLNYAELFEKLGLREEVFKSGALKDVGSGARNLTPEERELLQALVAEGFENFEADVREARGDKVRGNEFFEEALDARLLSANMALRAGLVDEVGVFRVALERAAERGGVAVDEETGEPAVCVVESERGFFEDFFGFASDAGRVFASSFVSSLRGEGRAALDYE